MNEDEYLEGIMKKKETKALHKFYVAGVQYHKLKTCINEVEVGTVLAMRPEPTNKFDSNAIRLEFPSVKQEEDIMVGYVPATISAEVSAKLEICPLKCEVIELNREEESWKQCKVAIKEV